MVGKSEEIEMDVGKTAMQIYDDSLERLHKEAVLSFRKDDFFARRVQQVVAYAMQMHGPVNPEYANREAHDIAMDVAAILFRTIYEDDAEIRSLTDQRDTYRKLAEQSISLQSPPLMVFRGNDK